MVSKDPQQLKQFAAHFVSDVDGEQACNYAAFMPMEEISPLQVPLLRLLPVIPTSFN